MLVAAAVTAGDEPDQCSTENSVVRGPAGKSARYAELATDAARRAVPDKVTLKDPSIPPDRQETRRLDSAAKGNGTQNSAGLTFPGEEIAVVAHPPVFDA